MTHDAHSAGRGREPQGSPSAGLERRGRVVRRREAQGAERVPGGCRRLLPLRPPEAVAADLVEGHSAIERHRLITSWREYLAPAVSGTLGREAQPGGQVQQHLPFHPHRTGAVRPRDAAAAGDRRDALACPPSPRRPRPGRRRLRGARPTLRGTAHAPRRKKRHPRAASHSAWPGSSRSGSRMHEVERLQILRRQRRVPGLSGGEPAGADRPDRARSPAGSRPRAGHARSRRREPRSCPSLVAASRPSTSARSVSAR